jgi:lipopolysaccharide/colanic/teichoic acid biosynthesis glycosyltransferase
MLDFMLSFFALMAIFPILLILTVVGFFAMGGNPFFTQERPGRHEKVFKLIKFRTMNNKKDKYGNLLSDEKRLTAYGKWLRSTSLDELPELFNILNGDMSIVGPRPLLVKYLPYYTKRQHHRHDVRPGLTGYAQAHGRNATTWDERFEYDLKYVKHITFIGDVKIIIDTAKIVLKKDGISAEGQATMGDFVDYVNEKKAAAREV